MRAACAAVAASVALAAAVARAEDKYPGDYGLGASESGERELNLIVGENRTISARGVKNFSEGAAGIAEVKLTTDRSKFVVVGRKVGSTSLLLIKRDGTQTTWLINVFRRSPEVVEREVAELLQVCPTLQLRRVGTRFFIEGAASSAADVARAERIAALYPGQVESLVVSAAPATERKLNIRIDFFFVQYDKLSGHALGVDWPERVGGESVHNQLTYSFLQGTTTTATASVIDQPLPALDIASRSGWAKVLKQSTVITANGTEASFESGGEQNFLVSAAQTASIQPIEHGTKVVVLPRLDPASGDLEIGVTADVAHLVPPVQGTSLPGRSTSKLTTTVRMKLGQSLILSGIRASSRRESTTGLPLLSEIPVLGVFFGSHRAQGEDVENALFVIPTAVESVPRPALEMVSQALAQFQAYSGDFSAVSAYPKQPEKWQEPR